MSNNSTFMEVSNKDIYDAVKAQDARLARIENHVIETNGKVKLARWVATTSLTLVLSVIMFLVSKG
jgi:hypothetical protein